MIPPLHWTWDGEALVPQFPKLADKHLVVGERYCLTEHHERSSASHAQYFAALQEAWASLPEALADEYQSVEMLRHKMLIATGYADEQSIVCTSKAEAARWARIVGAMNQYSVVIARDCVVRIYTPQSQSYRAMGKQRFQESKEAVLNAVNDLLGVRKAA